MDAPEVDSIGADGADSGWVAVKVAVKRFRPSVADLG
jgi:hypothetical protein